MNRAQFFKGILRDLRKLTVGCVCGAIVGLALGLGAAWAIAEDSIRAHPGDGSAGSVGIIVIFTAPAGAMFGMTAGGVTSWLWPRLFYATFVPGSVLVLLLFVWLMYQH